MCFTCPPQRAEDQASCPALAYLRPHTGQALALGPVFIWASSFQAKRGDLLKEGRHSGGNPLRLCPQCQAGGGKLDQQKGNL